MKRNLITLDFETYYTDGYTLSGMSAIEYVFDPRFEIIGVSVKVNNEPAVWFSGSFEETWNWLTQFNLKDCIVAGHNMSEFDSLILWRLGIVPHRYVCTLQLARFHGLQDVAGGSLAALCTHFGLPPKGDEVIHAKGKRRADFSEAELARYGAYCINDTERCYDLIERLSVGVPPVEWVIMDQMTKFVARPVMRLDDALLTNYQTLLADRDERLLAEAGVEKAELSSADRFAALLRGYGVEPPLKPSPSHPESLIYAFAKSDAGMKELLDHEDDMVATLAAVRLNVKSNIEQTRTTRFLKTAELMGGYFPMPQRYCGAHTGRGSGTMGINVLNLSAREKEPVLKRSIKAPPGHIAIAGDSGQIEARLNAWNAGQDDLIEAFRLGRDVYREFAGESIYRVALEDVDTRQRQVAKSAVLGAGFMMGWERFQEYVRVTTGQRLTDEEAKLVIETYRARYVHIAHFWKVCKVILNGLVSGQSFVFGRNDWLESNADDKTIKLPSGRFIRYPGLHIERVKRPGTDEVQDVFVYSRRQGRGAPRRVFVHPGLVTENIIQAVARDVVLWQAAKIGMRYPVFTTTYDEVGYIAPIAEREEALEFGRQTMLTAPSWLGDMPLKCDIGAGASYGDC